jgi:hypothetical protein
MIKISPKSGYIKELAKDIGCSVAECKKLLAFFRVRRSQRKVFRPGVRDRRGEY